MPQREVRTKLTAILLNIGTTYMRHLPSGSLIRLIYLPMGTIFSITKDTSAPSSIIGVTAQLAGCVGYSSGYQTTSSSSLSINTESKHDGSTSEHGKTLAKNIIG